MSRWILQISAGSGPVEVRAFVSQLAPALAALCRQRGLVVHAISSVGPPDAPRSADVLLGGDAPVALTDLLGTHALIARRANRGSGDRKRWFAGVALHPDPALTPIVLDPSEVTIRACRAGGPGGQHVNTTASAIRATHTPTGIAVRVEEERSQGANRKLALRRLAEALARQEQRSAGDRRRERRDAHYQFTRGAPVCLWRRTPRGTIDPRTDT